MAKTTTNVNVGRKRRAAGWSLLAIGSLVAAIWAVSGWWELGSIADVGNAKQAIWFSRGSIIYRRAAPDTAVPWPTGWQTHRVAPANPGWKWWTGWERRSTPNSKEASFGVARFQSSSINNNGRHLWVESLLWPIPLFLCTPAAFLLRSGIIARRRVNTNACPKCGYSLAGLAADSMCPECGKGAFVT